jgi:uncharacterized membrane protein
MSILSSKFSRVPKHSVFNYEARYAKEEKGLENRKTKIQLEKGSFYKNSKTLSKFRNPSIAHYEHNTTGRKIAKYALTLAMMTSIYVFYVKGGLAGLFALGFLLLFLIIFIRLNNKA